ncbi:type II toxin-antitoxin system RelE/ParE family toxin [Lentilactobacillus rapi]|uniref:type II toxin-antitoxin system RelE/ParE family toxin n=1 Tax=Lentilactobacillus rapi TaxID=481723 RepID=UPI003BF55797
MLKFQYYNYQEFTKFLDKLSNEDVSLILSRLKKLETIDIVTAMSYQMIKKLESNLYEIRIHLSHGISRSIYFKTVDHNNVIVTTFIKNLKRHPSLN